jgi:hypothetical protein
MAHRVKIPDLFAPTVGIPLVEPPSIDFIGKPTTPFHATAAVSQYGLSGSFYHSRPKYSNGVDAVFPLAGNNPAISAFSEFQSANLKSRVRGIVQPDGVAGQLQIELEQKFGDLTVSGGAESIQFKKFLKEQADRNYAEIHGSTRVVFPLTPDDRLHAGVSGSAKLEDWLVTQVQSSADVGFEHCFGKKMNLMSSVEGTTSRNFVSGERRMDFNVSMQLQGQW